MSDRPRPLNAVQGAPERHAAGSSGARVAATSRAATAFAPSRRTVARHVGPRTSPTLTRPPGPARCRRRRCQLAEFRDTVRSARWYVTPRRRSLAGRATRRQRPRPSAGRSTTMTRAGQGEPLVRSGAGRRPRPRTSVTAQPCGRRRPRSGEVPGATGSPPRSAPVRRNTCRRGSRRASRGSAGPWPAAPDRQSRRCTAAGEANTPPACQRQVGSRSKSTTSWPRAARRVAMAAPAGPPPTIATSASGTVEAAGAQLVHLGRDDRGDRVTVAEDAANSMSRPARVRSSG